MKKFISLICLIIVCFTMSAQESVIGSYYNHYAKKVHEVGWTDYGFAIETTTDTYSATWYITPYYKDFQTSIAAAKNKFIEWKQVCEDNNMHDVDKYMNITFPTGIYNWNGSRFDLDVKPKARFIATKDGKYYCALFFVDKITDMNNKYITTSATWILSNEEEFDRLAELVSVEKLKEMKDKQTKQNELLK